MKQRIWELDALRGVCIIGMVLMHLLFDISVLFGLSQVNTHPAFRFFSDYGGIAFLLISGICVTFSRSSARRGMWVFFFGLICTAVTAGLYFLGLAERSLIIYFGVLHCLGMCMLLWPAVRRLPDWALAVLGVVIVVVGDHLLSNVRVQDPFLLALGLLPAGFASSDYFPLLPNFGWFLLGAVAGRTAYRRRQTLLPKCNAENPVLRFFRRCGRYSLFIYLVHQPVLTGLIFLWMLLKN